MFNLHGIYYADMFVIISLVVSIVGLFGLLALKEKEQSRGKVFFPGFRKQADLWVLNLYALFHAIPKHVRDVTRRLVHHGVYQGSRTALLLLRVIERRLMKLLNLIRGKGVITKGESSSAFLKHVAEHKNGIRERRNGNHPEGNIPV